jgi:hypothetical protein
MQRAGPAIFFLLALTAAHIPAEVSAQDAQMCMAQQALCNQKCRHGDNTCIALCYQIAMDCNRGAGRRGNPDATSRLKDLNFVLEDCPVDAVATFEQAQSIQECEAMRRQCNNSESRRRAREKIESKRSTCNRSRDACDRMELAAQSNLNAALDAVDKSARQCRARLGG